MTNYLRKLFFSDLILRAGVTKRIAYLGVMTAFSVVTNMFLEFRMFDLQFSLTIIVSVIMGMLIGALPGFLICFLGDFLGYVFNSWGQLYMPWVGLSTGAMALIAGMVMNGVKLNVKGGLFYKLAAVCVLTFAVCTVGINSTGFYFYNKAMGFSEAVLNYVAERFGGETSYFAYLGYRLIFNGQIFNNIANYAVLFVLVPLLYKSKAFGGKGFFAATDASFSSDRSEKNALEYGASRGDAVKLENDAPCAGTFGGETPAEDNASRSDGASRQENAEK